MKPMALQYLEKVYSQNVDIERLRPQKSYDYLIENRNASLKDILQNKEKLETFLQRRNCPCCQADEFNFLYTKDSLDVVQCKNCDVVYVNPIFREDKYLEIYQSEQYQTIVKKLGEDSHEYRKQRFGKERVDFFENHADQKLPKRLLDIGCSTGFVVEEAQDRGWKSAGVELNPSAADFARKRGLTIHSRPLEDLAFEEQFSVIGLFDVLEHLVNPIEIMQKVRELLMPGGNIFIYVPNYNSASKEILGVENAHFIWPTHHLTYFTPITLNNFLENMGFDVFLWETQGLDMLDIQWFMNEKKVFDTRFLEQHLDALQFYINSSGHGKNLRMFAKKKR